MTVEEMIEKLQQFPPHLEVSFYDFDSDDPLEFRRGWDGRETDWIVDGGDKLHIELEH